MKVKTESAGGCRRVLRVDVEKEAVDEAYGQVLASFVEVASIPGFRKGRAPKSVVETRFAKDIDEELRSRLIPRFYREAMQSEKILPVAVVDVSDVILRKGEGLAFTVTVDVPPDFTLPKYKGLSLAGKKVEVTDEHVAGALDALRNQAAVFQTVTGRPVAKGDLVQIDYRGSMAGAQITALVPKAAQMGAGKDFWTLADEAGLIPGLGAGLVGMSVGETKTVAVKFPPDHRVEAIAGKDAEYVVTVKGLREKRLPELDEAFSKQMGCDSVDALRDGVRRSLARRAEEDEKARLKNDIVRELLDKTALDVPDSLVEEESRKMIQDIVQTSSMRGVSREQILEQRQDILNHATKSSRERVKLEFILDAVAAEEKLVAEDADVERALDALAARYRADKATLRKDLEDRGAMDRLMKNIRVEKALDLILVQADVKVA